MRRPVPLVLVLAVILLVGGLLIWRLRSDEPSPSPASPTAGTSARAAPPSRRLRIPSRVQPLGVDVVDAPAGTLGPLTGTVLSRGSGRPVPGATLLFETPSRGDLRQVRVGSDGAYRFEPDEPGWHRLVAAEAEGFVPYGEQDAPFVFHARPGRGVAAGPITLRPIVPVAIVVIDAPTGEPLADALVLLLDGAAEPVATNDDGEVTLSLDDGAVVEATAPGHRPGRARYGVAEQVAHRIELALQPIEDAAEATSQARERLAGVVQDPSGEPVEEARVRVRWVPAAGAKPSDVVPHRTVATSDDGTFVLEALDAGRYDLVARAEGFAEAMVPSVAVPGPEVTVTLVAGVSLFGEVTDRDREPMPSFTVVVTQKIHALASHTVAVEQAIDPDGQYEVPHLAPGDYTVFAVAPGAARSEGKTITLTDVDRRLDFELTRAGTLAGWVVEREGGEPIVGAKVSLESDLVGDLQLAGSVFTDGDGAFTLGGMPAVPTSILVAAEAHHPRLMSGIAVGSGETETIRVDLGRVGEDETPKIELAGIGAILQGTADGLVINQVVDSGGAAEVGLGPGDIIVTIEGADAAELGFGACIERLRGPEDSTVTVTVLHPGADGPVSVVIPRRRIKA